MLKLFLKSHYLNIKLMNLFDKSNLKYNKKETPFVPLITSYNEGYNCTLYNYCDSICSNYTYISNRAWASLGTRQYTNYGCYKCFCNSCYSQHIYINHKLKRRIAVLSITTYGKTTTKTIMAKDTVIVQLNGQVREIKKALSNVPSNTKVLMILMEDYSEVVFEEPKS